MARLGAPIEVVRVPPAYLNLMRPCTSNVHPPSHGACVDAARAFGNHPASRSLKTLLQSSRMTQIVNLTVMLAAF